jgi:hypothetical protein
MLDKPHLIGPGEVVLVTGEAPAGSATTLRPGDAVEPKFGEIEAAARELAASELVIIEIEAQIEREQLTSLLGRAEGLERGIELRFVGPSPVSIGSGEVLLVRGHDIEGAEVTLREDGSIQFAEDVFTRAAEASGGEPVSARVEGSTLSLDQVGELVNLARDANVPLKLGFRER